MRRRHDARAILHSGLLILLVAACGPRPPVLPPAEPIAEPDLQQIESVVFFFGDAGAVRDDNSPLLVRLRKDIERWSGELGADGSVIVVALGDIVYPDGVRPANTQGFHADTAIAMSQVRLVSGPLARRRGARLYFLAGNHDWGGHVDLEGLVTLTNLAAVLDAARVRDSANVRLVPQAGTGGPYVLDLGQHLRMVMLDTAWWLLEGDASAKGTVLTGIDEAFATAGDRETVIAAHHPFKSAGPHGGGIAIWRSAGARYLLSKSGAILQDLTSAPYRALESGLRDIFGRHRPPLVFAGGHEHSLQVFEAIEPTDPAISLVSGAGSKSTRTGREAGMRFARSAPGYMRLLVERDGGVTLFVESADPAYLKCPDRDPARARCMAEGANAFRTVFSERLR